MIMKKLIEFFNQPIWKKVYSNFFKDIVDIIMSLIKKNHNNIVVSINYIHPLTRKRIFSSVDSALYLNVNFPAKNGAEFE